jgi:hypothetical protein
MKIQDSFAGFTKVPPGQLGASPWPILWFAAVCDLEDNKNGGGVEEINDPSLCHANFGIFLRSLPGPPANVERDGAGGFDSTEGHARLQDKVEVPRDESSGKPAIRRKQSMLKACRQIFTWGSGLPASFSAVSL